MKEYTAEIQDESYNALFEITLDAENDEMAYCYAACKVEDREDAPVSGKVFMIVTDSDGNEVGRDYHEWDNR